MATFNVHSYIQEAASLIARLIPSLTAVEYTLIFCIPVCACILGFFLPRTLWRDVSLARSKRRDARKLNPAALPAEFEKDVHLSYEKYMEPEEIAWMYQPSLVVYRQLLNLEMRMRDPLRAMREVEIKQSQGNAGRRVPESGHIKEGLAEIILTMRSVAEKAGVPWDDVLSVAGNDSWDESGTEPGTPTLE